MKKVKWIYRSDNCGSGKTFLLQLIEKNSIITIVFESALIRIGEQIDVVRAFDSGLLSEGRCIPSNI